MVRIVSIPLEVVLRPGSILMQAGDVLEAFYCWYVVLECFPNFGCVRPQSLNSNQRLSFT